MVSFNIYPRSSSRSKTREITIVEKSGAFSTFFKMFGNELEQYDFEGLSALRKLLSNEKARILHTIKTRSPKSIYELSKMLKRDFKSVAEDIKLLERFGVIEMIREKTGGRERLRPILVLETLYIQFKI